MEYVPWPEHEHLSIDTFQRRVKLCTSKVGDYSQIFVRYERLPIVDTSLPR